MCTFEIGSFELRVDDPEDRYLKALEEPAPEKPRDEVPASQPPPLVPLRGVGVATVVAILVLVAVAAVALLIVLT